MFSLLTKSSARASKPSDALQNGSAASADPGAQVYSIVGTGRGGGDGCGGDGCGGGGGGGAATATTTQLPAGFWNVPSAADHVKVQLWWLSQYLCFPVAS